MSKSLPVLDTPDPTGRPVEQVRRIRDQIDARVRQLLDQLTAR